MRKSKWAAKGGSAYSSRPKRNTINRDLSCVRRVLNLAARQWRHPNGMTYLETPPLLSMAKGGKRAPYPVMWEQQALLFPQLPAHLDRMAFNIGLREGELCSLRWSWLQDVPEFGTSVFVLPDTKNGQPRVVVLNRIAKSVLESVRGQHPEYVFSYRGLPHSRMNNSVWRKARARAGLPLVRVHDLRHTFGHRLRAAGVSFEDRQDLIGHKSERMTTHYSAPELSQLIRSAELLCEQRPATILRVVGK